MGVDAVLITPTCADPFYRRSIKVSMGTVFQVPWTRLTSWPEPLQVLKDHGFTTAALALTDNSITLDALTARHDEKLALIFGTEGHGLKPHVLNQSDLTVKIPMAGGVDSLNVASAAAVTFYATRP
jgi:tRNA G18 (ribose-2'-O)-methylase SpoU